MTITLMSANTSFTIQEGGECVLLSFAGFDKIKPSMSSSEGFIDLFYYLMKNYPKGYG